MRVAGPYDGQPVSLADTRLKAAVLLAPPGSGANLAPFAAEHYPVLRHNDFATMTTPSVVVGGGHDASPRFSARADWRADGCYLRSGPKALLTVFGGEHGLGGIAGYDAAETTDEHPERAALVQHLAWAYLRSARYPGAPAGWPPARSWMPTPRRWAASSRSK